MLCHFSHEQLFEILWTVAYQAPLSMGFSRQEYWSGLPFPLPGDLPNPGTEHTSLRMHNSPALAGGIFILSATWEGPRICEGYHLAMSNSLGPNGIYSPFVHWILQERKLRQEKESREFLLTQGSYPGLVYCRQIFCHLSHQGSSSGT